MKKVLLINIEAPSYSSIGMITAFREAFEEVRSINWQGIRFGGGRNGLEHLWEEIARECKHLRPDLIMCQFQRGDILTVEQWQTLSEIGFVINYTEDVREDISWYEEVAPHIGLTIFTNMDDCRKFWDKGLRAAYMMVSYNHLWYKPQPKTQTDYGDIIFIGNNFAGNETLNFPQAQERADMCKFMKEKFGDRFSAYGLGMEYPALNPMQCVEAYNNCKIAITHNNFKREGYCSDRGLNAMGCGALTIHQHFVGIEEMFKDFQYLLTWEDFDDLKNTCELALDELVFKLEWSWYRHNKEKQVEYTKENHSWHNRVKFVKGFIKLMQEDAHT